MSNIKRFREPPHLDVRVWWVVDGQRVRVIFQDEPRPAEPHIVVQRVDLVPPPPSKTMLNWINGLRAKYQLGGI